MSESNNDIDLTNEEFFEVLEKKKANPRLRKPLRAALRSLFTKPVRQDLYEVSGYLSIPTKAELGVNVEDLYAYIQDPLVAANNSKIGILPFAVRWEPGLGDGPTSARFAVVDYNMDSASLIPPAVWNAQRRRFEDPAGRSLGRRRKNSPQFHQANVWAVAQTVLEYFENGYHGMGRPIPWGFDGNRLLLVPHAGYGQNAFYDRHSKSLQFYYFGDDDSRTYTCLSHDIIAHEMGHAILDGIRPLYFAYTSVETAAFHEFVGDLDALLLILRRNEVRSLTALETKGKLRKDKIISGLAEEFGKQINGSEALRNAHDKLTLNQISDVQSPHFASRVLTTAMFEIMVRMAEVYRKGIKDEYTQAPKKKVSASQALNWASTRFARLALRPIDMCQPMDIRFIDYARAVLHNFESHEPGDSQRLKTISGIIRDVFHEWQFCSRTQSEHNAGICDLDVGTLPPRLPVHHNIQHVARSRTAAYYYINDNRKSLQIPQHQDIEIIDLYGLRKYGRAAHRLPAEIVIEYMWREEYELSGKEYGQLQGQPIELLCGGTLVLDERANIISLFRKPGVESPSPGEREVGRQRRNELKSHILNQVQGGYVGLRGSDDVEVFGTWTPPVVADNSSGALRLEITPHIRESFDPSNQDPDQPDPAELKIWDREEDQWTTNF